MKLVLMTITMMSFSCNSISKESSQYTMKCKAVGNSFYRCENKEVVCYNLLNSEVLQCKFKEGR